MKNRKFFRTVTIGITVILSCSLLFGCGKSKNKQHSNNQTASSSSVSEEGETTTSKFSGDKGPTASPKIIQTPRPTANNSDSSSTIPSRIQSELDDAKSFAKAGMYEDAQEMLDSVDKNILSEEQLAQYEDIQVQIEDSIQPDNNSFTPEDAVRIVEEAYGIRIEGDLSELTLQTNSGGSEYYRMQVQVDSENEKRTINVYQNGDIEVISTEPIAFG